jgi:hypothetical protein
MNFFNYCFYRISSAYKFIDGTGFYIYGNGVVSSCQAFNTISLISVLLTFFEYKLSKEIIISTIAFYFILNLFLNTKNKFNLLSERWKEEKHKTLKGWLVFAYVVASLVLFFVSLYI